MKKAKDFMNENVALIHLDESIQTAAKMMRDGNYGAIPIYDNDRLQGMITDRDITTRIVAEGKDPNSLKVKDCMSEGIRYCFEEDSIEDVAEKMSDSYHRRYPVLNKDKRLVGIISLGDLARAESSKTYAHEALDSIASASPH